MKTEFLLLGIVQARFGFNPGAYSYRNVFKNTKLSKQYFYVFQRFFSKIRYAFSVKNIIFDAKFFLLA